MFFLKKSLFSFSKPFLPFLVLLLFGFAAYSHILHAPFHYDDHELMLEHELTQSPLLSLKAVLNKNIKAISYFTFALNYQISRTDPFGYHLINLLLHIFSSFFLYCVVKALLDTPILKETPFPKEKKKIALFIALVFLLHPLQTQAVTYIWQRTECLSGFLYLAAYLLYLTGRLKKRRLHYVSSLVLFVIGFFAKGIIISLPVLILLTEASFFDRKDREKILWGLKLAAGCLVAFILMTFIPFGPLQNVLHSLHCTFMHVTGMQLSQIYFLTQFRVIPQYIRLLFIPVGQNLDYYFPMSQTGWNLSTILGFLFVCLVLLLAALTFRKKRFLSFGIWWFFICLLPTTFIYREPIWEHRLYLPAAGFAIFLAGLCFRVKETKRRDAFVIIMVCLFCALTIQRNFLWKDPLLLMEDTVRKSPNKARPNQVLGMLYRRAGKLEQAEYYLKKALSIKPNYPEAYNNLGLVYFQKQGFEKARKHFKKAILHKPHFISPYVNLATLALSEKDYSRAEEILNESLAFGEKEETYLCFGNIFLAKKEYDKARESFQKAMELNPQSWEAYYSLGNVWFYQKEYQKAILFYEKAKRFNPHHCDVYLNTGMAYYYLEDMDNAQRWLEKAKEIDPKRSDVRAILEKVFYRTKGLKSSVPEE